jgi:hypothetical protein
LLSLLGDALTSLALSFLLPVRRLLEPKSALNARAFPKWGVDDRLLLGDCSEELSWMLLLLLCETSAFVFSVAILIIGKVGGREKAGKAFIWF